MFEKDGGVEKWECLAASAILSNKHDMAQPFNIGKEENSFRTWGKICLQLPLNHHIPSTQITCLPFFLFLLMIATEDQISCIWASNLCPSCNFLASLEYFSVIPLLPFFKSWVRFWLSSFHCLQILIIYSPKKICWLYCPP